MENKLEFVNMEIEPLTIEGNLTFQDLIDTGIMDSDKWEKIWDCNDPEGPKLKVRYKEKIPVYRMIIKLDEEEN